MAAANCCPYKTEIAFSCFFLFNAYQTVHHVPWEFTVTFATAIIFTVEEKAVFQLQI